MNLISMGRFARTSMQCVAAILLLACIASCANQKEPALQAIASAESALQTIAADAQKFAPAQYAEVTGAIGALKASFDKGDYKTIVTSAPAVMTQIKALANTATTKKDEVIAALKGDWSGLAANVPNMIAAIQSRVDILSHAKKLPAALSAQNFDLAKSGLDSMKQLWRDASSAYTSGDMEVAVNKAKNVQDKGHQVLALLGMAAA